VERPTDTELRRRYLHSARQEALSGLPRLSRTASGFRGPRSFRATQWTWSSGLLRSSRDSWAPTRRSFVLCQSSEEVTPHHRSVEPWSPSDERADLHILSVQLNSMCTTRSCGSIRAPFVLCVCLCALSSGCSCELCPVRRETGHVSITDTDHCVGQAFNL
jgi:hypothetical protein